jgi:DNA-directed RNA polymerase subunit RPC12/RpoP
MQLSGIRFLLSFFRVENAYNYTPSNGEYHPQTLFFKANKKLQGDENTLQEKIVKCPNCGSQRIYKDANETSPAFHFFIESLSLSSFSFKI